MTDNNFVIPFDAEAEKEVIGSMLFDKLAIVKVLPILCAEDFYIPQYKEYFKAITQVFNKSGFANHAKVKDIMILSYPELVKEDIDELSRMKCGAAAVVYYAKKIKNTATKRAIIHLCDEMKAEAFRMETMATDITEELSNSSFKLSQGMDTSDSFTSHYEVGKKIFNDLDEMRTTGTQRKGIRTGITYFDNMTNGLRPGQVMILAASTSAGKTAMAINIALDVAERYGKVAYFSYEMEPEELIYRLICYKSGVSQDDLNNVNLTDEELVRISDVISSWQGGNLKLDKTKCETVALIKARCRNLKVQSGLELIVIDYISQIPNGGGKPIERIANISREIKLMAMELQVPVIALSQLNRADLEKPPRRPNMYNLKETSAIEQDADIVALLYRPGFWGEEELKAAGYNPLSDGNITEMTIAKNRSGKTGKFRLLFDGTTNAFHPYMGEQNDR